MEIDDEIKSSFNPIQGGVGLHPIQGGAFLHTPSNFWTTGDTELQLYMVRDIHKLFPKIEKIRLKVLIMRLRRQNYANFNRF